MLKNILVVSLILVFTSSSALSSQLQPLALSKEDKNLRLSIGGTGQLHNGPKFEDDLDFSGFGISRLGGGIGIAYELGLGMELGLSAQVGSHSPAKLFDKKASDNKLTGLRMDIEAMFRMLLPFSNSLRAGGQITIGYGHWFNDEGILKAFVPRKDFLVTLGPAISLAFLGSASVYASLLYNFDLRLAEKSDEEAKFEKSAHGIELPIGLTVDFTDTFGIYAEFSPKFKDLKAGFKESFALDAGLGANFRF